MLNIPESLTEPMEFSGKCEINSKMPGKSDGDCTRFSHICALRWFVEFGWVHLSNLWIDRDFDRGKRSWFYIPRFLNSIHFMFCFFFFTLFRRKCSIVQREAVENQAAASNRRQEKSPWYKMQIRLVGRSEMEWPVCVCLTFNVYSLQSTAPAMKMSWALCRES